MRKIIYYKQLILKEVYFLLIFFVLIQFCFCLLFSCDGFSVMKNYFEITLNFLIFERFLNKYTIGEILRLRLSRPLLQISFIKLIYVSYTNKRRRY